MIDALTELAERQFRDYHACTPGTCFADPGFALDLAQAYALQDRVSALRVAAGERVAGYKVGCTGPGTVAQFGMAGPIRGYLYEGEIRETGARLDLAAYPHLAIEGEMALRIGDDGQIAAAFPIVELHRFIFRGPRPTLGELIANNGFNAGIVLPDGAWLSSRRFLDRSATLSVRVNGSLLGSGALWPLAGGPAPSLSWLRQHLSAFGRDVVPGHIVLAGTPLGLYPVASGSHVAVFVDDQLATQCWVV